MSFEISSNYYIGISEEKLSFDKAVAFVDREECGAVSFFIGKIRNHNLGKKVTRVSYDIFDKLALLKFKKIVESIIASYNNELIIYLEHYKGDLLIREISIVIAVSSPHRAEAFSACRQIIEQVKHTAPIWKKEFYTDGESSWVKGHSLCKHQNFKETIC